MSCSLLGGCAPQGNKEIKHQLSLIEQMLENLNQEYQFKKNQLNQFKIENKYKMIE